jgi:hypothetical protein
MAALVQENFRDCWETLVADKMISSDTLNPGHGRPEDVGLDLIPKRIQNTTIRRRQSLAVQRSQTGPY